jgi:hypothetical protein
VNRQINILLGESILLQIKTGELYRLLWRLFPDDAALWSRLCAQQECHALKLTAAKGFFYEQDLPSSRWIDADDEFIQKAIGRVFEALQVYRRREPAKREAVSFAVDIESSLKEIYFNFANNLPFNTLMIELLREILPENKAHLDTLLAMLDAIDSLPGLPLKGAALPTLG